MESYERLLRTAAAHAPEEDEEMQRLAMEDLALLLLQRNDGGDKEKADALLRGPPLGYRHRLSTAVLVRPLGFAIAQRTGHPHTHTLLTPQIPHRKNRATPSTPRCPPPRPSDRTPAPSSASSTRH